MSNINRSDITPLLWKVHDECMYFLMDAQERPETPNKRINRLTKAMNDLAKALEDKSDDI